jgi:c-di-GMP-related signal transduction protein
VAGGGRSRIRSLRDAITVLGRSQLGRWLQILLFTNPSAKGSLTSPLLQLAATRGRFMELLAGEIGGGKAVEEAAFMTGIISLMPALLGLPMESILAELNVGEETANALRQRSGRLGALLRLSECQEQGDFQRSAELLGELPGLTAHLAASCETRALAWATSIGNEGGG